MYLWLPYGSAGKESSCSEGDLGSIPVLVSSPGEGNGYALQYSFFFFNFYFYFILLYNTVLVLPYINMNPPRVYIRSQTRTPLPPPSP